MKETMGKTGFWFGCCGLLVWLVTVGCGSGDSPIEPTGGGSPAAPSSAEATAARSATDEPASEGVSSGQPLKKA